MNSLCNVLFTFYRIYWFCVYCVHFIVSVGKYDFDYFYIVSFCLCSVCVLCFHTIILFLYFIVEF